MSYPRYEARPNEDQPGRFDVVKIKCVMSAATTKEKAERYMAALEHNENVEHAKRLMDAMAEQKVEDLKVNPGTFMEQEGRELPEIDWDGITRR